MYSDKRNFIYRVHKDHRNPGNISKLWAKNRGPVILVLSEKLRQNHAQSVNLFFNIGNSFLKVMADIPTLPAYPGAYWFWHKNLPVCGTGQPTPGFWNFAHFSQSWKMFSIHIMFSAVFSHIRAKNFKSWYNGFKKLSLHRTFLDWECLLIVSSNALIHCSLSSESRADKKINISWVNVRNHPMKFISSKNAICLTCWINKDLYIHPFAPEPPITAQDLVS